MKASLYFFSVLPYLLFAAGGFCLGGVLFSYHLPKLLKHIDICTVSADHNPGTFNAFRYAGVPVGILCLLCDLAKGFLPVFAALRMLDTSRLWFALILAAPVLGHAVAPLYHDKSGKAIAVSFGVLIGLLPESPLVLLLVGLYLFFSLVLVLNPHERRTVWTFGLLSLGAFAAVFVTGEWSFACGTVLLSLTVIAKNFYDAKTETAAPQQSQDTKVS